MLRYTLRLLYWFFFSYNIVILCLLRVLLIPHCGTNHTMLAHTDNTSWHLSPLSVSFMCLQSVPACECSQQKLTILHYNNYYSNSRIHLWSVWGIHNVVLYWYPSLLVYNNNYTVLNWFRRLAVSACIRYTVLEFLSILTFLIPHGHKGFPKCMQLKY